MKKPLAFALIALVLSGEVAWAAPGIDFTAPLVQLDGKPAQECKAAAPDGKSCAKFGPITLGEVCAVALSKPDKDATLEVQVRKGALAQKIIDAQSATLTTEEISLIKAEVAKLGLSTVLVADVIEKLDPAMAQK